MIIMSEEEDETTNININIETNTDDVPLLQPPPGYDDVREDVALNNLENDNDSNNTILPDYVPIRDDDELLNHVYIDNMTNSIRISLIRVENNIKNIKIFAFCCIVFNLINSLFIYTNYILYDTGFYNFTDIDNKYYTDNENQDLNKKYEQYKNMMLIYFAICVTLYLFQYYNYYHIDISLYYLENRSRYYFKKKIHNILTMSNQIIPLLSIIYLVKNTNRNIVSYEEIFLILLHSVNYVCDKVFNFGLNINIYLNLY